MQCTTIIGGAGTDATVSEYADNAVDIVLYNHRFKEKL